MRSPCQYSFYEIIFLVKKTFFLTEAMVHKKKHSQGTVLQNLFYEYIHTHTHVEAVEMLYFICKWIL